VTDIIHRGQWQTPQYPVTGMGALPAQQRFITLHWPGGDVNTSPASAQVATLRAMQRDWVTRKGYSLGYNFVVFPDGATYGVREFDIRCAANGSQAVNIPGVAILLAVPDMASPPSSPMIQAVRDLVAMTRAQATHSLVVNGHKDVRPSPTACPGARIEDMIHVGIFEPKKEEPPPTPVPPTLPPFDPLHAQWGLWPFVIPKTVKKDSTGDEVKLLQGMLYHFDGLQGKIAVDGKYGDQTVWYVTDFQKRAGLYVDGITGNETWGALYEIAGWPGKVPR
jgi:hypothetical protein